MERQQPAAFDPESSPSSYAKRFSGIARLYGVAGAANIRKAHVCVIGVGGVGSWAVEALSRSGIGAITMVDLDDICVSNINRQVHALDGEIGKQKLSVMAARIYAIHPECRVHSEYAFFTESTAESILATRYDFVLDAIDNRMHKCLLIARCKQKNIPIITVGGAGGRRDPTQITIVDLSKTRDDPLLQQVRKHLRAEYGFTRNKRRKFGVPCVYSQEVPVYPHSDGSVCTSKEKNGEGNLRLDCDSGYGSATFVTGAFGFAASAYIVQKIAER